MTKSNQREASGPDKPNIRLDDAARAAWLHFIAGNTQHEVARTLGISRQSVQRLISLAVEARLVNIQVTHPIARCMELGDKLQQTLGLRTCTVTPTDPHSSNATLGVAEEAAAQITRLLSSESPVTLGVGTGRTLSAAAALVPSMNCPHHRIVACVGSTSIEGWAIFYDVVVKLANTVRSQHYPMPVPVMANSPEERQILLDQNPVRKVVEVARNADVIFLGIGHLLGGAGLFRDRFVTKRELESLRRAGAVGEIVGWAYDAKGRFIKGLTNDRVVSIPPERDSKARIVGLAKGEEKVPAIVGAARGRLINGLITDEHTADRILSAGRE